MLYCLCIGSPADEVHKLLGEKCLRLRRCSRGLVEPRINDRQRRPRAASMKEEFPCFASIAEPAGGECRPESGLIRWQQPQQPGCHFASPLLQMLGLVGCRP